MVGVFPILYFGYKFIHKTHIHKPEEVDLQRDVAEIEEYQRNYIPTPPKYVQYNTSFPTCPTLSLFDVFLFLFVIS